MSQQGQGDVGRRDIVLRLEDIADASLREDGTDIPLGEQLREAAREITRLRTLLSSSRGEQGWRDDIKAAPHGKKVIVRAKGDFQGERTMMARFYPKHTLEAIDGYGASDGFDEDEYGDVYAPEGWYEDMEAEEPPLHNIEPTHWMPLPSAPGSVPTSAAQGWREALVTASMALTAHNDWQLKRTDPEVLDGVEYIPAEAYAESTLYELTDDALSRIKACEAGSVPTSLAGQVPDGYAKALQEISALAATFDDEREAGYIAVAKLGRIARAALIAAAPQPTAGGDAP